MVYSVRKKQEEYQQVQGSVMDDLLNDENAILDLDKIMKRINSDGTTLSVDDILWREKYILSPDNKMTETQPVEFSDDVKPVIVTDIRSSCEDTSNPLLEDLTRELNRPFSPVNDIVLIHRDVLDEEGDEQEDDADLELRRALSQQQAIVQCPSDVLITESILSPSHESSPFPSPTVANSSPLLCPAVPSTLPLLHTPISSSSSPHLSFPNSSPLQSSGQTSISSTESRRESFGSTRTLRIHRDVSIRSAKENIVRSETVIHEPSISAYN